MVPRASRQPIGEGRTFRVRVQRAQSTGRPIAVSLSLDSGERAVTIPGSRVLLPVGDLAAVRAALADLEGPEAAVDVTISMDRTIRISVEDDQVVLEVVATTRPGERPFAESVGDGIRLPASVLPALLRALEHPADLPPAAQWTFNYTRRSFRRKETDQEGHDGTPDRRRRGR